MKEGNPGKAAKARLDAQVVFPPVAPAEPDWSEWFHPDGEDSARCIAKAKATWRQVVPLLDAQGFLATCDLGALADLCVCEARLLMAERDVTTHGLWVQGERGIQKNPAVTAANQYRTQARHLWTVFYLTPGARARADGGAGGSDDDDDPFD